jgi:hypothetical protein
VKEFYHAGIQYPGKWQEDATTNNLIDPFEFTIAFSDSFDLITSGLVWSSWIWLFVFLNETEQLPTYKKNEFKQ